MFRAHAPVFFAPGIALALALGGCSNGVGTENTFGSSATFTSAGTGESGDGDGDDGSTSGYCGDQACDPLSESCQDCPADCGACVFCGDQACNGDEDCITCALDCGVCPGCGDGTCAAGEDCNTCPQDCTEGCNGPSCGDGQCSGGEDCISCEQDCGMCGPLCGDGSCNNGETCNSCAQDCGACTCPCSNDPNFDNFCFYAPNTPNCPMTMPNGYCDPNGDGSYMDGDWNMGWFDYQAQCG